MAPASDPISLDDDMASNPPLKGDTQDFAQIAEIHRPFLLRIALWLSGNSDLAKDLVQETLLRAMRRSDRLQKRNPGAWLVTILTNLFYDYLKHQKVVTRLEPTLRTLGEADIEIESNASTYNISDGELHAAVQSLGPELRQTIEYCYFQNMGYRQVAEILKVPVGTIGTRLMRARRRLRKLLRPKLRIVSHESTVC